MSSPSINSVGRLVSGSSRKALAVILVLRTIESPCRLFNMGILAHSGPHQRGYVNGEIILFSLIACLPRFSISIEVAEELIEYFLEERTIRIINFFSKFSYRLK